MKAKCVITVDLETGDFDLKVENLTSPGEALDYAKLKKALGRIFEHWDKSQPK